MGLSKFGELFLCLQFVAAIFEYFSSSALNLLPCFVNISFCLSAYKVQQINNKLFSQFDHFIGWLGDPPSKVLWNFLMHLGKFTI